ncbi:PqqD family protein [Sphingobacterium suaedae]|uniref:PqqD family protein n=1 Tax=Sphingobacterium suaedae TaxID=1686402 RepID=A0ABW5KMD4_9SPHI
MKLKANLTLRQVGNEHIIVEPNQGMVDLSKVFTLNETAAFLWKELDGQDFEKDAVVQLLMDNYDVDEDQAQQDAIALLDHFRGQGLLVD